MQFILFQPCCPIHTPLVKLSHFHTWAVRSIKVSALLLTSLGTAHSPRLFSALREKERKEERGREVARRSETRLYSLRCK